jgi:bacterioferritin-associated ferredoxin
MATVPGANGVYICVCNAITKGQVCECAHGGTCPLEELASALGVRD